MDQWITDLTTDVLWATDIKAARAGFRKLAKQAGIELFAYGRLDPSAAGGLLYGDTSYPDEWTNHYLSNNYVSIDPVVAEAMRSPLPFSWRFVNTRANLRPEQRQIFVDAAKFGLREGLTTPFHDKTGCTGLISLAFNGIEELRAVMAAQPSLRLLGLYYNAAVERLLIGKVPMADLSLFERECLTQTAAGRKVWNISTALHRTETDITGALHSASRILGTCSINQAVAKALAHEIISP